MRAVDFILEHDINTTSVYDIEMEQLIAEMEVYSAIISECGKQAMILEYATDASVFAESGDGNTDTNAEVNNVKSENAKKKWYQAVKDFFVKIGQFIYNIFTKTDYEKMIDKVEAAPDNVTYEIPNVIHDVAEQWQLNIEDYTKLLGIVKGDKMTIVVSDLRAIKERIIERAGVVTRSTQDHGKERVEYNKEEMLTALRGLMTLKTCDAVKKIGPMLKAINTKKSEFKGVGVSPEVYPLIKDCAKLLYTTSNRLSTQVLDMMKAIVKGQTPKKSKNKKSDGDGGDE